MPQPVINKFKQCAVTKFDKIFEIEKQRLINKLNNLLLNSNHIVVIKDLIDTDNKVWVLNTTNVPVPKDVENLLALGPKFSVEQTLNEIPI